MCTRYRGCVVCPHRHDIRKPRFRLVQEDDGDEDFEPPPVDEEEEGEEAGVRRRNIQARELNDLVQDAYKQVTPWPSNR